MISIGPLKSAESSGEPRFRLASAALWDAELLSFAFEKVSAWAMSDSQNSWVFCTVHIKPSRIEFINVQFCSDFIVKIE